MTRLRLVAVTVLLAVVAACGNDAAGIPADDLAQLDADVVPAELAGLTVTPETVKSPLDPRTRSYVRAFRLFGLRKGDRVEATLQVAKLVSAAKAGDADFRSSVIQGVGAAKAEANRMGKVTVYRTSIRKQSISVWFGEGHFFVLSVRDTYNTPRALLRAAVEDVNP